MVKITPTTGDQLHGKDPAVGNGGGPPIMKIVAAHEPVKEPGPVPWTMNQPLTISPSPKEQNGNVAPTPQVQPLKIALIGTAPSSRMLAPFADTSWKIWACSPGNMNQLPRVDAWFEIHGNMLWPENKHYGEPYLIWLKNQTFPIYMQDQKFVPNAISLPKDELVKEFGPYFFTSSFAWMMAMAMKAGAKEIALYGIDMASRDEYIIQRPGAYFFFEKAKERGIKMSAPYESDIMQPPALYGYSEVTPFGRKLLARQAEIRGRLNDMRAQRDSLTTNITYLDGALEDIDYTLSIHGGVQNNLHPDFNSDGQG